MVSNFVNFGLDLFLMFVLGWGVAGAGDLLHSHCHVKRWVDILAHCQILHAAARMKDELTQRKQGKEKCQSDSFVQLWRPA